VNYGVAGGRITEKNNNNRVEEHNLIQFNNFTVTDGKLCFGEAIIMSAVDDQQPTRKWVCRRN